MDPATKAIRRSNRRDFLQTALALGATAAFAGSPARSSINVRGERRDLYPEGVASGDPDSSSVILWTRRPSPTGLQETLQVEISETAQFDRVVATAKATVSLASDWTCRILVGQ